jgi:hypothetical protein
MQQQMLAVMWQEQIGVRQGRHVGGEHHHHQQQQQKMESAENRVFLWVV